jgi:hypothetical protein
VSAIRAKREAQVTFEVAGLPADATPRVAVRDWELNIVARVSPGDPLVLAPGRYLARLMRPGPEEDAQLVTLEPGEEKLVLLAGALTGRSRDVAATVALSAASTFAGPDPERFPYLVLDDDRLMWYLRVVSTESGLSCSIPSPRSLIDDAFNPEGVSSTIVSLELPSEDEARYPLAAQVARSGMVPLTVTLPALSSQEVWLRVQADDEGKLSVATSPPGEDRALQTLIAYLLSGLTLEAYEIANDPPYARGLLFDVLTNLQRLRSPGRWEETVDLEGPDWLVDPLVIAGERALRMGQQDEAAWLYRAALTRGLPIFTETLALLTRRVTAGLLDEVEPALVERLLAVGSLADLTTLTTTFLATNASEPQASPEPLENTDDWFAFRGDELKERVYA